MSKQLIVLVLLVGVLFSPSAAVGNVLANPDDIATITDLPPNGRFIVLAGDFNLPDADDLLLFDFDKKELLLWDLQPAANIETVLARNPILLGNRLVGEDGRYVSPTPPEGSLLAISLISQRMAYGTPEKDAIWSANLDGSDAHVLAKTVFVGAARWSSDGKTLLFEDRFRIRRVNADGSGLSTLLTFPGLWARIGDWSADGNGLTLTTWEWLYHFDLTDNSTARLLAASRRDPFLANSVERWSPDSYTLAILVPNDSLQSGLSLWSTGAATMRPLFAAGVLAAAWSPDSQQLAIWGAGDCQAEFDAVRGYLNQCSVDLYAVNANGQGLTRLTSLKIDDSHTLDSIQWIRR